MTAAAAAGRRVLAYENRSPHGVVLHVLHGLNSSVVRGAAHAPLAGEEPFDVHFSDQSCQPLVAAAREHARLLSASKQAAKDHGKHALLERAQALSDVA